MTEYNLLHERYRFHQRCQQSEETLLSFVEDVRKLAESCNFQEQYDALVRDKIVFGLYNLETKWRIIHDGGDPTLLEVIDKCQQFEQKQGDVKDEQNVQTMQCTYV